MRIGTESIRGKSYDAETGAYFTTDWTKLVVLNGPSQTLDPNLTPGLQEINPDKPFGRLEKADPRRINMHIGAINPNAGPAELRYTTIPYDAWLPGFSAVRDCKLDHVLPVKGPGVISEPYKPKRSVELVVAELWQGGRRIDHEERPIGIPNDVDRAPDFTRRAEIPSLDDQIAELRGVDCQPLELVLHPLPQLSDGLRQFQFLGLEVLQAVPPRDQVLLSGLDVIQLLQERGTGTKHLDGVVEVLLFFGKRCLVAQQLTPAIRRAA